MNKQSEAGIYVYNIELSSVDEDKRANSKNDHWWEFNVSEQFPMKSMKKINGRAYIEVGSPHEGCKIKASLNDNMLNGEAYIYSNDNSLMASLTYVDGIASGPCSIYNNDNLYFQGYFINGYRGGRGKDYDENGNMVFDGFFKEGKKLNLIPSEEMGKGYWKEIDEKGQICQICQKDELGNTEGFVYSFRLGEISRVSLWKEGKEVALLKLFNNSTMTEYKNGKIVYEGGYLNSLEMGYPRNEEGIGRRKDDETGISNNNIESNNKEKKNESEAERFCRTILENRFLSIILVVFTAISFYLYFDKIYLNSGPYGIKYNQESYIVESGYGKYLKRILLFNYPNLKYINIGNNCFPNVKIVTIDGLKSLESIIIGKNSFTPLLYYKGIYEDSKSFYIINCQSLRSIEIGPGSFQYYKEPFELKNLHSLESIKIGKLESYSPGSFEYSSFEIESKLESFMLLL